MHNGGGRTTISVSSVVSVHFNYSRKIAVVVGRTGGKKALQLLFFAKWTKIQQIREIGALTVR